MVSEEGRALQRLPFLELLGQDRHSVLFCIWPAWTLCHIDSVGAYGEAMKLLRYLRELKWECSRPLRPDFGFHPRSRGDQEWWAAMEQWMDRQPR
jgi:hypothetical protein